MPLSIERAYEEKSLQLQPILGSDENRRENALLKMDKNEQL
jgi:hypothetical protein